MAEKSNIKHRFILQVPLDEMLEEDRPVFGDWAVPQTVMIPSPNFLRVHQREDIFSQAKDANPTMEVDEEQIRRWRLKEGDHVKVEYRNAGEDFKILSVNNVEDPKVTKSWPMIFGVDSLPVTYSDQQIPIEHVYPVGSKKSLDLRGPCALGPPAFGQSWWMAGSGDTGKTTLAIYAFEAIAALSVRDIQGVYMIACITGEHPEEYMEYYNALVRARGTNHKNVELLFAPRGEKAHFHVQMFEYAIRRARRLTQMGFQVVLFLDAITRVVISHSRSPIIQELAQRNLQKQSVGMIGGGIKTNSLLEISELQGVSGKFIDSRDEKERDGKVRSLTLVSLALRAPLGEQTSESAYTEETMHSHQTAQWVLTANGYIDYPKFDVHKISARHREYYCSDGQLDEHDQLWHKVRYDSNGDIRKLISADKELKRWVEGNQKPPPPK